MILVDSSCWIEFYRPDGDPEIQAKVARAVAAGQAATCDMIRVEILAYIKRSREFDLVSSDFAALHQLPTRPEDVSRAIALGRDLRARGLTVPATDLLIAATAIGHGCPLLHADRHFDAISELEAP
jgi:predicted nucleic acid-binding protein